MHPSPHPLLLNSDTCVASVDCPGRLEHHIAVLEEVLEGGGRGSDTKNATGFRAPGPLDPGVADARVVEGSVDPGCYVLDC